jgi:hypothetical protein
MGTNHLSTASQSWSAGEARFDMGGPEKTLGAPTVCMFGLRYARVIVIVCVRKEDGLVGRAPLQDACADLRAGWIELRSAERHSYVERDDLVPDRD